MPAGGRLSYSEAVVLLLIYKGVTSVKGIARALRVSQAEAERIVRSLEAKGLVRVERGFLGRTRVRLTQEGLDAIPEASRLVEEARRAILDAAERARDHGEPPVLDAGILSLTPALLFLGLLPAWVLSVLPILYAEEEGWWAEEAPEEPPPEADADFDVDLDAGMDAI